MANFVFNAKNTGLGTITVYVGGTTSTTTIDANLMDSSDILYDFTKLESFQLGNVTLTFSDFANAIRTNLSSIYNQVWIIDVDGTKYFHGLPMISSISFNDVIDDSSNDTGIFSVTLGSDLLNTSGSYSGLTSYDTNFYSLSDVIEQTVTNNTGISTFSYLSTFSYSSNGETVYLDKDDAGASDAFIAILKTSVHSNTDLNGVFNILGLRLAIWKNTCYIWQKNYTGATATITGSDVIGRINYQPYQKLDDFYVTATMRVNHNYLGNNTSNRPIELTLFEEFGDDATRLTDGNDFLPLWSSHSLGNWTTSNVDGSINVIKMSPIQYSPATSVGADYDNFTSDYWTNFVLFRQSETAELTLDNADFYNSVSTGDVLKISMDAFICAEPFYTIDDTYSILFTLGTGETVNVDLPMDSFGSSTTSTLPTRIEFDYTVTDPTGDIVITYATTDSGWSDSNASGNVQWDGANTVYNSTLIINDFNAGDYIYVKNAAQSAFDGVYEVVSITTNQAVLDRDPYTTDTNTYSADYEYFPLYISIGNINISKVSKQNKQIDIFSTDQDRKVIPSLYSYDKDSSDVEDGIYNLELRYGIMDATNQINASLYSPNTDAKRLTFNVLDSTIDPYDAITFSQYGVTNGISQKFGFSLKDGSTKLTVVK